MSIRKSIAQLIVSLGLDSASYKTGLKNAKKDAHGFSASARQAFNSARTGVNQAGIAVTAAAATVTAATAVMVKQQMQQIDQLAKFSDRLGITTVALSGLRHQAELNGVAQNQLDTGLQRMVRRVAEAAKGTGEAVKALDELGMSAQQLSRLSPEKQFAAIADKMKDVDGQSNRVRLAFKLFDAEGVGMVNMMRDGAEGLAAAQAEAVGLGIAINRIDAAKIEAANDATYRAKSAMDGLGKSITIAVTPYITEIANEFFNAGKESNGFRDQVTAGMEIAVTAVGYVSNAVRGMHILWKGAQVLVAGFAANTLEMLSNVRTKLAEVANMIPGVTVDVSPDTGIALMAQVARDQLETLKVELHELAMQELPSEASDRWFKRVQTQADEAARKVANVQAQINSGGANGSGSPIDPADYDSINATQAALQTKMEAEKEAYDKRQETIENAYRDKLITEEKYNQLSARNSARWAALADKEQKDTNKIALQGSAMFFANMATLSEHGNKNLMRIGKAAAVVNIIMSTIVAAQNAYEAGSKINTAVAVAFAASAVVAGGMRLRQLKQVQPGGSASLSAGGLSGQTNFDQNLPSASSSMPDTAAGINSFNRDTQTQLASREERKAPTVNMIEDASRAGQVQQLTEDDVINIYVSNIHNQGEIARAQETTYQMTRYGT
jgi:hypothetical protein